MQIILFPEECCIFCLMYRGREAQCGPAEVGTLSGSPLVGSCLQPSATLPPAHLPCFVAGVQDGRQHRSRQRKRASNSSETQTAVGLVAPRGKGVREVGGDKGGQLCVRRGGLSVGANHTTP